MSKRSNVFRGKAYPGAVMSWRCDSCGKVMGPSSGRVTSQDRDYCTACVSSKTVEPGLGPFDVTDLDPDTQAALHAVQSSRLLALLLYACSRHGLDCHCVPCDFLDRERPNWRQIEDASEAHYGRGAARRVARRGRAEKN